MWLSWERALWFCCFLLHVIHLDLVPRFRLPPSGGVFPSEGKKTKKWRKNDTELDRKKVFSFTSLCAILIEVDGDSFEPEAYWLVPEVPAQTCRPWNRKCFRFWPRFVVECKCMMNAWFLCVCSGVDRLQGLALASALHSAYPRHVDDGRTIDETGRCAVVELHYWVNSAFWWTLYIALAALFGWCFGLLLCFVWRFSLLRIFAALICSARFSPNSLWSPLATLAFCNFSYCILATAIHLSRAPEEQRKLPAEQKNPWYWVLAAGQLFSSTFICCQDRRQKTFAKKNRRL